mgnify:CR=1 FL=1
MRMTSPEQTNPGMPAYDPNRSRPVHFGLKDYGVLVTILGALFAGLFFLIRTEVEPVAMGLAHHVEIDDRRHQEQREMNSKLEAEQREQSDALHRIEIRQVQSAPRHVRDKLPPAPRRR